VGQRSFDRFILRSVGAADRAALSEESGCVSNKARFEHRPREPVEQAAGNEQQVAAGWERLLVQAEKRTQATLRAIALDRISHCRAGGNYAEPPKRFTLPATCRCALAGERCVSALGFRSRSLHTDR